MPQKPKPDPDVPASAPFWREKTLEQLSPREWESLCDGCGRCCLVKLIDEDTDEIHYTDIGCKLFDADKCACKDYRNRRDKVPDCIKLTPDQVRTLPWLPPTCGYRLVAEGKDLAWWHPLVSGRPETVHEAGISTRGRVGAMEGKIRQRDYVDRIVDWPNKAPRSRKPKG
jgi:uncharacterized cysteine cluster protein YcgN (CxxCxxCC family)